MTDDIVNRLRNKRPTYVLVWQAADEIERLRAELDGAQLAYRGANYDRDRMRVERDQARRLVCRHTKKTYRTLKEMAEERGWDCFKKEEEQ